MIYKNLFFFLIFLLPACATTKKHKDQILSKQTQLQDFVGQLTMIPDAPLGFNICSVVHDQNDVDNVEIVYVAKKRQKNIETVKISDMYRVDMETLGWDCISSFGKQHESLLWFMRPENVWCQIVIQDSGVITLTVMQKK